jgi:hypothetical protein
MTSGTATLTGTLAGQTFRAEVTLPLPAESAAKAVTIGALWARARIRDLEEHPDFFSARGSRQRRSRETRDPAAEIAALGVRYQLCSRATSFVAIEHREVPSTEQAQLRRIPVMLTNGWGGADQRALPNAPGALPPEMRARRVALHADDVVMDGGWMSGPAPVLECREGAPSPVRALGDLARRAMGFSHGSGAPPTPVARRQAPRLHDEVIRLQRADGSWDLTDELLRLVRVDRAVAEAAIARHAASRTADGVRALATGLALAWLEREAADAADEWTMVAGKARRWLEGATAHAGACDWIGVGRSLL